MATLPPEHPLREVKALLFDVFGTVVDWQGSVVRQLSQIAQESISSSHLVGVDPSVVEKVKSREDDLSV